MPLLGPPIAKPRAADRRAALGLFILRWFLLAVLTGLIVGVLLKLV